MVSPHLSSPTSYQLVHARCRCRVHPCIWRTRRFHPTGAHFSTCIPPTDQWTWTHRGWEYRSCHLHSSDPLRSSGCALWISPPKLISMQTGFQSPPPNDRQSTRTKSWMEPCRPAGLGFFCCCFYIISTKMTVDPIPQIFWSDRPLGWVAPPVKGLFASPFPCQVSAFGSAGKLCCLQKKGAACGPAELWPVSRWS